MESFVYVAVKFVPLSTLQMSQFADQVNIRLFSQLINNISKVLQFLHKYFNGTTISTFTLPKLLALFVNLDLNLSDSESFILS